MKDSSLYRIVVTSPAVEFVAVSSKQQQLWNSNTATLSHNASPFSVSLFVLHLLIVALSLSPSQHVASA